MHVIILKNNYGQKGDQTISKVFPIFLYQRSEFDLLDHQKNPLSCCKPKRAREEFLLTATLEVLDLFQAPNEINPQA